MTTFKTLADSRSWQSGFEQRLGADYRAAGYNEAAAEQSVSRTLGDPAEWTVAEISADGTPMGFVAVKLSEENGSTTGRIGDLWVAEDFAGQGHEPAGRGWAERWCSERGAVRIRVQLTRPTDLFADYGVRGQTRVRVVTAPSEPLDGVTARPMTEAEYPRWLAAEQEEYIADIVRSGALTPEQARQKSDQDFARLLPEGQATALNTFLVLEAGGESVGTGWLKHALLPGVTFGYSLHVAPEHRGKGYGRAAMAVGERATLDGGDSALMFHVWGGNEVAMNLYTTAGYQVVEENRSIDLRPEPASAVAGLFSQGKLTAIPRKAARREQLLAHLTETLFEPDRDYTEPEVNEALLTVHPDSSALRRYLVEARRLARTSDGSTYRRLR